jgi:predicted DNA-binding transcriptional regulator YafY
MMQAERYLRFVLAMLEPRPRSDGWVQIKTLIKEVGASRATIYRLLIRAQNAGLPVIYDSEERPGQDVKTRGVRCSLVVKNRDPEQTS